MSARTVTVAGALALSLGLAAGCGSGDSILVAGNEPTEIETLKLTLLDGAPCIELTERARAGSPRFDTRTFWLDPLTFIPRRSIYVLRGEIIVTSTTLEVKMVQGIPTPSPTRFVRPLDGQVVDLFVDTIDYRKPIDESFFSTLKLIKH